MRVDRYTRYPRAILWLVREGELTVGETAVTLRVESFYLGKSPITNLQYEAYDPDHLRSPASCGDDDPVVDVDFDQASLYCNWYARLSGKPMRLPTEIEWEYACRGGTTTRCFYGDDPRDAEPYVWDAGNSGDKVGRLADKRPNPLGLLGMLGGVWEWTSAPAVPYPPLHRDDPCAPELEGARVLRGGSFRVQRERLGSDVRWPVLPDLRQDDVGFRIARSFRG